MIRVGHVDPVPAKDFVWVLDLRIHVHNMPNRCFEFLGKNGQAVARSNLIREAIPVSGAESSAVHFFELFFAKIDESGMTRPNGSETN